MIGCGIGTIAASLIALAVDRCLLERRFGTHVYRTSTGRIAGNALSAIAVAAFLIIGAVLVWFVDTNILRPLNAEYLFIIALVMIFALLGLLVALPPVPQKFLSRFSAENGKTVVLSTLLGLLTLVPAPDAVDASPAFSSLVVAGAKSGALFLFVKIVYTSIREKQGASKPVPGALAYAHEFALMGVLALVLYGIAPIFK
jgi:Na+-translocating ferredoxin:NAD+ oxidoreductase RnfA subunit